MFEKVSGAKIKKAIKESGKTQAEIAKIMGCKQSFISQMIIGKSNVSLENLKKIADITKKPLNFFIEESSSISAQKDDAISLRDFFEEKIKRLEAEVELLKKEIELLKMKNGRV